MSKKRSNTTEKLPVQFIPTKARLGEISISPKVRQSGHFIDVKLKYNHPSQSRAQLNLFDLLNPDTIKAVGDYEIKFEGIRLTASEERLIAALYKVLKSKSENKDAKSERFYKGNHDSNDLISYGRVEVKIVNIRFSPAELYKAYLGNENYSGKEIRDINRTIEGLEKKRFLITYDRKYFVQVGKKTEKRTDRIERASPLIEVIKYTPGLTDAELARLDKGDDKIRQAKGEFIIALNPILTDQIDSKYIEYPEDLNRRTIIAAGGDHRSVTEATTTLRDWLAREVSAKRYECQFNADTLPFILHLDNYVKQGRKKLIKETIDKAIQTCKNLNLITEIVETKGVEGQDKYVFRLNPDWLK